MSVDVYVDNTVTTRIPRQLIESDTHGKGAAEIGWGTPGDFKRCQAFAKIHGIPAHMRDGFCANLHKLATGEWPGRNAHKGMHALIASAALDYMIAAAGTDQSRLIRWEGPLALVEQPTGDRRRFPRDTLTFQTFPMPFRFQRVGLQGHQGAVTVGVIEHAAEKDHEGQRVVYGRGYFLDPAIVPEVNEAVHLAEHGVTGPSVDLDSYTAVIKKNALSGETTADMVRGRQRAATLVSVPAFANLRITVVRPKVLTASTSESSTDTANLAADATFAVNQGGWAKAPIAPREALFDADDAAKRIEAWANGDPNKMASMFLWIADSPNAPLIGRRGYRLPWGDIIDGKPYLIYHAVYAGAALLQHAHGGLPNIPDDQKGQLRSVITEIYQKLAKEFDDPNIIAPWDRGAEQVQQASGLSWDAVYDVALEEFVRHHRYREVLHPRDKRKDDHAGEWIDTPHGPHGQIKIGGKWVYPPKRGEKGYKDPEGSARGIAKRGGGKPSGSKSETKHVPSTHVARKARPAHRAEAPKKPTPDKAAPPSRADKLEGEIKTLKGKLGMAKDRRKGRIQSQEETRLRTQITAKQRELSDLKGKGPERGSVADHMEQLRMRDRMGQRAYLRELDNEEIDKLLDHVGGRRLEDDTREDLETEIIHQVNKTGDAEQKQRRKDEQVKERDRVVREIAHESGGETKIVKKKEEPKKAPPKKEAPKDQVSLSDRLTLRLARDSGEDGMWLKHADSKEKRESVTRLREGGLLERHRKGNRTYYKITDKGHEALKGHEDEEPKSEAPRKEAPKTRIVRKKSGEQKGFTPNPAQEKTLEAISQGGKGHPGSRKVLQREGYVDENGNLTQKGRDHVGVKETPGKEEPKAPPKKEGGTKVAKKVPAVKVSPAQQKALEALSKDPNAKVHPATRKVLTRDGYLDDNGDLTKKGRDHLGLGEQTGDETQAREDAKRLYGKVQQLKSAKTQEEAGPILKGLKKDELVEVGRQLGVKPNEMWGDSKMAWEQAILDHIEPRDTRDRRIARQARLTRETKEEAERSAWDARVAEADELARKSTKNPHVLTGSDRRGFEDAFGEDTGPLGVPIRDFTISQSTGDYVIRNGRAIRKDGVLYLIEDPKKGFGDIETHQRTMEGAFKALPPGSERYQRVYTWARGANPSDPYWRKRYDNPRHTSLAMAGDGHTTVWQDGMGYHPDKMKGVLAHEFGHNVDQWARQRDLHSGSGYYQDKAVGDIRRLEETGEPEGFFGDAQKIHHSLSFKRDPAREIPGGVSGYGKSSWDEDYAESMALYMAGQIGYALRNGERIPVYFRDIWPGRASVLDELFPKSAEEQLAAIRKRGRIPDWPRR